MRRSQPVGPLLLRLLDILGIIWIFGFLGFFRLLGFSGLPGFLVLLRFLRFRAPDDFCQPGQHVELQVGPVAWGEEVVEELEGFLDHVWWLRRGGLALADLGPSRQVRWNRCAIGQGRDERNQELDYHRSEVHRNRVLSEAFAPFCSRVRQRLRSGHTSPFPLPQEIDDVQGKLFALRRRSRCRQDLGQRLDDGGYEVLPRLVEEVGMSDEELKDAHRLLKVGAVLQQDLPRPLGPYDTARVTSGPDALGQHGGDQIQSLSYQGPTFVLIRAKQRHVDLDDDLRGRLERRDEVCNDDVRGMLVDDVLQSNRRPPELDDVLPHVIEERVVVLDQQGRHLQKLHPRVIHSVLAVIVGEIGQVRLPNPDVDRFGHALVHQARALGRALLLVRSLDVHGKYRIDEIVEGESFHLGEDGTSVRQVQAPQNDASPEINRAAADDVIVDVALEELAAFEIVRGDGLDHVKEEIYVVGSRRQEDDEDLHELLLGPLDT